MQNNDPLINQVISHVTGAAGEPVKTDQVQLDPDYGKTPSASFLANIKQGLAARESGDNYGAQSHNSSASGKYQFIDSTRQQFAPDSTRESFLQNPQQQEQAMDSLMQANMGTFQNRGIDVNNIPKEDLAGLLYAAHLQGAGKAADLYQNGNDSSGDANGVTAANYFNLGKKNYLLSQNSGSNLVDAKGEKTLASTAGAAQLPFSNWDYIKDQFHATQQHQVQGNFNAVADQVNPILDEIKKKTGQSYDVGTNGTFSSLVGGANIFGDPIGDVGKKFDALLAEVKNKNPELSLPVNSFSDVLDKAAKAMDAQDKLAESENGRVGFMPWIGGKIAEAAGWMADPVNLVGSAAIGAAVGATGGALAPAFAGSLLGEVGLAGVTGAATEAIQQPLKRTERGELGQAQTNPLEEIGETAAGFAAGTGVAGLIGKLFGMGAAKYAGKGVSTIAKEIQDSPKGAENVAKLLDDTGGDADAIRSINDALSANPAGRSAEATEGMAVRLDKMYENIQMGKNPSPLPQNITGVRAETPYSPLDMHVVQAMHDEGFTDAAHISEYMSSLKKAMADQGNITSEELNKLPATTTEVPTVMEQVDHELINDIHESNKITDDLLSAASRADSEMQSRLSQWGTSPEMQQAHLTGREGVLQSQVDYYTERLKNDVWTDQKGYATRVEKYGEEEANDQARRHVARSLEKMQEELKGVQELKEQVSNPKTETSISTESPLTPEVQARLNSLKVDLPNAQAVLASKMDLADRQITGLKGLMEDTDKQLTSYQSQMSAITGQLKETELGDIGTESQRYKLQQAIDDLNERKNVAQTQQERAMNNLAQHQESLKSLQDAVSELPKVKETGDLSPLAEAEAQIKKIREDQAHMSNRYAMKADELGTVVDHTSMPREVQRTAEQYSALRALKDCMGL